MNKNTILYGGATGLAQIFSFVALFAYTSELKPDVYATIAIFETMVLLLQSCISGAIDRSSQRFYLDKDPNKVISTSATIALVISISLFPVIMLLSYYLEVIGEVEMSILYFVATSYVLQTIVLVKYQFSEKPICYFLVSVTKSLSFLLSSAFFLYTLNMQEGAFLRSSLVSAFLLFSISLWITKPNLTTLRDTSFVRDMLRYSLPFVPTLLASWIITWSSRFFMVGSIEANEIGVFSAAQKVAMAFFIFTQAITLVATPILFRKLKDGYKDDAINTMLVNVKFLIVVSLSLTFFLPDILNLFMGEEYSDIQKYITLLMFVNFISAVLGVSSSIVFNFYKQTALQMKIFIFISIISVSLNAVLISKYQMVGLIISMIIPTVLLFFMHFYFLDKKIKFTGFSLKVIKLCVFYTLVLLIDFYLGVIDLNMTVMVACELFVLFLALFMAVRSWRESVC
ncbi:oligosaccharide flippase family protein [Vibrio gallaecicus]|uniref:oligosaccharide flippase family protein n=1 Tax=Vibrio gallaecicus TaxID=552386 RepID=UPI00142DCBD6|nr:oligosaccharide flippase family protein [Vibrio gallaecicus]MDN3614824.1 oligosaccharide flippase family protein [Vibrio gallaecicus]